MTRILGIDPGSRKTGFGIVETNGKRTYYVTSGVIKLPVNEPLAARLKVLAESLDQIISEYQPSLAVIEQVFMAKSADSALKLGQARGAAMVVCALADLEVHEYATRQIKQAVVGTGGASKAQVQHTWSHAYSNCRQRRKRMLAMHSLRHCVTLAARL